VNYKLRTSIDCFNEVIIHHDLVLGKGATAIVYRASIDRNLYAAKIYHDKEKLNLKKIEAMIANPPSNLMGVTAGITYPRYSWPISIIEDSTGQPIGYVMPLIDQQESFTLDHYYDKNLGKKLNSPDEVALSYKIEIAANLSKLIADLHSHRHCFVDFKPQNIRVFKRTHAVTLLDCDGFSINNNGIERFPAELLSTDYISPEAFIGHKSPKHLGEFHDRYALAVIIFQLLNRGIHPFQGIPTIEINAATNDEKAAQALYPHGLTANSGIKPRPQSIHNCFDDETRKLFDRAFVGQPKDRPTAMEWSSHLEAILENKLLTRCDKHPYDIRHMRFMGKECPECFLQKGPAVNFTPIKPSIKLSPIDSSAYSSPIPPKVPPRMNSDDKATLLVGVVIMFLFIVIIVLNAFNAVKKDNFSYASPNSNSSQNNTTPNTTVVYTSEELGKFATDINRIHEIPANATSTYASGAKVSTKARKLMGFAWDKIIKHKDAAYYPLAFKLNQEAYELGHPEGASNMGFMYENGMGIPKNYNIAASWYQKAISMGQPHSAQAELHLGQLYQFGKLGQPDFTKATQLYNAAIIQANDPDWPGLRNYYLNKIQTNLNKISISGLALNDNKKHASLTTTSRPYGYASIYINNKSNVFSWVTGYPNQEEADEKARASCEEKNTISPCKKIIGGSYKCIAISQGSGLFYGALANSLSDAESKAKSNCEKENVDGICFIPDQGSNCVVLKEDIKQKTVEKSWSSQLSDTVVRPPSTKLTETIGWVTAIYPKYGYIEFELKYGKHTYSGQILISSNSGRKYRVSKVDGKFASAEPTETSIPIPNEIGNSLLR